MFPSLRASLHSFSKVKLKKKNSFKTFHLFPFFFILTYTFPELQQVQKKNVLTFLKNFPYNIIHLQLAISRIQKYLLNITSISTTYFRVKLSKKTCKKIMYNKIRKLQQTIKKNGDVLMVTRMNNFWRILCEEIQLFWYSTKI